AAAGGLRQRSDAARRDLRRGQHPRPGGRHRRRDHRLRPDGAWRRGHAIRRPADRGGKLGGADGRADGRASAAAGAVVLAAGAAQRDPPARAAARGLSLPATISGETLMRTTILLAMTAAVSIMAGARAEPLDELYQKAKAEKELVFYSGGPAAPHE